ncbi:fumarylacetoacetate hydrolase family protein [Mucilaginibacter sp.]|uniref:fumarylacetoacetate hydrolase family protein n=1 Tax=Mucilaginibacter sp. TaxID=1882438 RepID=UPI00262E0A80|nr:fumarylacetoacetate hydrolase family protein [Mucilaginibacter sp.]MDB4925860.1 Fumarylacetoacetate hydrolase [Mucilaginibacter sp.]
MKLATYKTVYWDGLGIIVDDKLYDLNTCDPSIPDNMNEFLRDGETSMKKAAIIEAGLRSQQIDIKAVENYELLAPVPKPASCRDGYAFRQHVAAARRNRGLEMIKEFDQYPVFYFTNHQAIYGPGDIACMPDHFNKLDFELEVAIVIGKQGRNIKADKADSYIAGYMVMNDMSARTLQMEEMLLNLGPAKGKDFATVIGPWLITPDELENYKVNAKPGHTGTSYNLEMTCKVNDIEVSKGNMADMDWTFAEIIERASYGCTIYPGDVIGSGTVGTGCFLELNGTGLLNDPNYQTQWLKNGDEVEMEITGLGALKNTIIAEPTNWSILRLKK